MNRSKIEIYRRRWLKRHRSYERKAFAILQSETRKIIRAIPKEKLTPENYERVIKASLDEAIYRKAIISIYNLIGADHIKHVDNDVRLQLKSLASDSLQREIVRYLTNEGGSRIVSMSETLYRHVLKIVADGVEEGKSLSNIVSNILRGRDFYRPQLFRIARTETTAAAGFASNAVSSTSGIVMEKVWVSALDDRTRRHPKSNFDHFIMDGIRVDDGEPFEIPLENGGFERLDYPGDPKGSAGNVINCRCSVIKVVKRDENGNIVSRF